MATHEHVDQFYGVSPMEDLYPSTAALLSKWVTENPQAKIMAFTNTARTAGLLGSLFEELKPSFGAPVFVTHSRLSQSRREKAMKEFVRAKSAVLFTSDVTARGIDIPDVTHVLQVGVPADVQQYIHRLGRTARAGKEGTGTVLLGDFESFFLQLKEVKELGLKPLPNTSEDLQLQVWRDRIADASSRLSNQTRQQSYSAWLGYYKGFVKKCGISTPQLVMRANVYARDVLKHNETDQQGRWLAPPLLKKTVGKMGLKGVSGLNAVAVLPYGDD